MQKNSPSSNSIKKHHSNDAKSLYGKAAAHIDQARTAIHRTVDTQMVRAYWLIGRDIVEEEQLGKTRADYGKELLKQLSKQLQAKYGRGFSVRTLEKARRFYLVYHDVMSHGKSPTLSAEFDGSKQSFGLSWSHYVELIGVKRESARKFYELEATKNNWNVRELRRQIDSFLYDRLAKSKDKDQVLQLACNGQEINTAEDAIKEPLVLEFLGVPEPHNLSETNLESALITNLQSFLLELGKGFAFVARQKRLSFDNNHFYADLVFYHVILKCYVIIDLKTHALTHGDLGQMQLYVNYFDREIKQHNDNPTIGLVLCTEKRDEMAKYMLGDKAKQIFASTYQFHLPTEEELEIELKREIKVISHDIGSKSKKAD